MAIAQVLGIVIAKVMKTMKTTWTLRSICHMSRAFAPIHMRPLCGHTRPRGGHVGRRIRSDPWPPTGGGAVETCGTRPRSQTDPRIHRRVAPGVWVGGRAVGVGEEGRAWTRRRAEGPWHAPWIMPLHSITDLICTSCRLLINKPHM